MRLVSFFFSSFAFSSKTVVEEKNPFTLERNEKNLRKPEKKGWRKQMVCAKRSKRAKKKETGARKDLRWLNNYKLK